MACAQALQLDPAKLNVNGGAIALGHPLAASGARITAHLVHELRFIQNYIGSECKIRIFYNWHFYFRRKSLKKGVGSACIGGGQGIALLLESV